MSESLSREVSFASLYPLKAQLSVRSPRSGLETHRPLSMRTSTCGELALGDRGVVAPYTLMASSVSSSKASSMEKRLGCRWFDSENWVDILRLVEFVCWFHFEWVSFTSVDGSVTNCFQEVFERPNLETNL